jgi:hypothetical protein
MTAIPLLIAEFEFDDVAFSWRKVSPTTREGLAVFGALILITILLIIWAAFLRRRSRRRSAHRHYHGSRDIANKPIATTAPGMGGVGKPGPEASPGVVKKRRRRRALPTNPTLAQTGGLPPIRTEDSTSS